MNYTMEDFFNEILLETVDANLSILGIAILALPKLDELLSEDREKEIILAYEDELEEFFRFYYKNDKKIIANFEEHAKVLIDKAKERDLLKDLDNSFREYINKCFDKGFFEIPYLINNLMSEQQIRDVFDD